MMERWNLWKGRMTEYFYFEDFFSLNSVKILFVNTSVQFIILDSRVWFLIIDTSVRFFILSYLVTDRFVPSQLSRCVPCSVVSKVINLFSMLTIGEKTSHLQELSNKKVSSINNRKTLTLKCYTSAGQYLNYFC